jgi:hypothetical protein
VVTVPTVREIKEALAGAGLQEIEKNKFTQLNADEGFCRGACMDWMRRVLQGRLAYDYERTVGKGVRREARMRDIHATVMGRVIAAAQEIESDLETRAGSLRARVNEINKLEGKAWEDAAEAYQAEQATFNQERRAYNAMSEHGPMTAGWSKMSRELDALRSKPGAKRTFSNITPASGSAPKNLGTSGRVQETIGKVVRELAPGSASMFTFKSPTEIGHSVSVVRSQNSSALFDPSYGMFAGAGVDPVVRGCEYLLNGVYPGMQSLEFIMFVKKA